jgi:hypothetical protein
MEKKNSHTTIYSDAKSQTIVMSSGGEKDEWAREQLARGVSMEKLCDEFNKYSEELFKLIEFTDEKEELWEELDDAISSLNSKEENKKVTQSLLETHVSSEKLEAFKAALNKI